MATLSYTRVHCNTEMPKLFLKNYSVCVEIENQSSLAKYGKYCGNSTCNSEMSQVIFKHGLGPKKPYSLVMQKKHLFQEGNKLRVPHCITYLRDKCSNITCWSLSGKSGLFSCKNAEQIFHTLQFCKQCCRYVGAESWVYLMLTLYWLHYKRYRQHNNSSRFDTQSLK